MSNLLNSNRRPIRTHLRKPTQLRGIKPQRDNGIRTPPHRLAHQALLRRIARAVHQIREKLDLAADDGAQDGADVGAPVAALDGEAVDGAEDVGDAVAGDVVHSADDEAVGVDVGGGGFVGEGFGVFGAGFAHGGGWRCF